MLAAQLTAGIAQQAHAATGRARGEHIAALGQAADVFTVKAIHVLERADGLQHAVCVDMRRQWQLHEDAVDRAVAVEPAYKGQQVRLGGVGGQAMFQRVDAHFLGTQHLVAHIHLAGGICPHQHNGQARLHAALAQGLHLLSDFSQYPRGGGLAVDQFDAEGGVHLKITVRSWLRNTRCSRWYFTARDNAMVSVSRPIATRFSGA